MSDTEFTHEQLARYSRHLLLPEIDLEGQEKLSGSSVSIIGAGGLGGPAALFLASSGVGRITIFDDDQVDLGNLQRQIAFKTKDIDKQKAIKLRQEALELNPEIEVIAHDQRATQDDLIQTAQQSDLLLDCCDNFETRFAINRACQTTNTPLVSGAAIRFQGQVTVFDPRQANSPCYHCLFQETEELQQETCRDRGVFAPLVGIIASIQAAEALKLLINTGQTLTGRLLSIDALNMVPRISRIAKDPTCPVCAH